MIINRNYTTTFVYLHLYIIKSLSDGLFFTSNNDGGLTKAQADGYYAAINHTHSGYAASNHTHSGMMMLRATGYGNVSCPAHSILGIAKNSTGMGSLAYIDTAQTVRTGSNYALWY